MIIGPNEHLESALELYREHQNDSTILSAMNMITICLAAEEEWLVPIDLISDGMNETDFPEEMLLEKLPGMVKKEFVSSSGKTCLYAFTSLEKVHMAGTEPLLTVRYPATDLLREFTQADSGKALVLNPSSDAFPLFPQDSVNLLSAMAGVPRAAVLKNSRISIEPKAVIDVQAILDAWNSGWSDNGKEPEKWNYLCCPIMADGRILLLFESCDEIYGSKAHMLHVDHTIMRYRVLEYRIGKDGPEELGRYRFTLQDGTASTVILYDGILKASVRTTNSRKETILPMIPTNDDGQFKIYENVRRIVSRSDGSIAVGYYGNLCDEARLPLMVYDGEGKAIGKYKDDHALYCADITLDNKEQIWFHLFPSEEILCLSSDLRQVEKHRVALQGFCGFALSDDTSKLFLDFGEDGFGSVNYVLFRDQNGDYVTPVRFDFPPKSPAGGESSSVSFPSSTMKSWVCIQADSKLYLYDINDI